MSANRCQCCHRYAPKGLASGEPVGECRGHAAIEEARRWALVWKERALEAGWVPPSKAEEFKAKIVEKVNRTICGKADYPQAEKCRGDCTGEGLCTCSDCNPPDKPKEASPPISKKLNAKTLTNDEKLHAKWVEEGKELAYCQGPRRHFFIVGSPMWDQLVETGCFHCGALPE